MKNPDQDKELDVYALIAEHHSQKYSVEFRLECAMMYVVTGQMKATARKMGISYDTIKEWRYTEWWPAVIQECRKRKQDELDGTLTGIIHNAMEEIEDRIANGDTKVTKDGDRVKVPMTGKDVATTVGILIDKRAAMRGDPTTVQRNQTSAEHLQALEKKLADFTKRLESTGAMASPIEGQYSNEQDNEDSGSQSQD